MYWFSHQNNRLSFIIIIFVDGKPGHQEFNKHLPAVDGRGHDELGLSSHPFGETNK